MEFFEKDFGKILKNNAQEMRHELLPQGTNCFRVYDRNLSQFPVTVDIYGKYAKVTDYGEEGPLSAQMLSSCVDICARMLYLEHENIIYSYRAKRIEREQHEKTEDNCIETIVDENNLHFKVDLATYVDTGLFLDHRLTRMLVRERSMRADVLNLFSYTGSFSVYAAAGGANSVKSIDMSATYTRWAEENLAQNGFSGDSFQCLCMDATKYVDLAIKQGEKFDIIIFDPPSFSNSRKMDGDFDVARDYVKWVKNLAKLLKKTGFILFSTNLGSFRMDKRQLKGLSVKEITGAVQAPGFIKGRKGTARSWMMALDDDSLKLDWSETSEKPKKKSEKGSDKKDSEKKNSYKKASERTSSERRTYERRRGERDKSYGARNYGSRDRHYSSDTYRENRSYDDYEEKPYRDRDYKSYSEKSYGSWTYKDRPNNGRSNGGKFSSERSYNERSYGERKSYRDRYDNNESCEYRDDRPSYRSRVERNSERGGYERYSRPRYEKSDRYERNDRRTGGSYDSYGANKERSRNTTGSRSSTTPYRGREDKATKGKKPYGFDSFKPARSRDDSSDFFWNSDDFDPKAES